jgi:DedD protein
MQWLKDEKLKHRIVGVAVLVAICIVIFPAMIKKSNQRLDEKMDYAVHLPPKPDFPDVDATKSTTLFKSTKVAQVTLPDVVEKNNTVTVSRAEPLSNQRAENPSILQKMPVLASHGKPLPPSSKVANVTAVKLPVPQKTAVFAVQIASFSSQGNALSLVRDLNKQGFTASFDKQGKLFRVLVGQVPQLDQAKQLQEKLASSTQLSGFIVKVG